MNTAPIATPVPPPTTPTQRASERARLAFIFLACVVVFFAVRVSIRPINASDYHTTVDGILHWQATGDLYSSPGYFMPPWSAYLLLIVARQPVETWLALMVMFYVGMCLDLGATTSDAKNKKSGILLAGLSGLILLAHPVFITQIASANQEGLLLISGLWLLYRVRRMPVSRWRTAGRALAWLLLTCKPQTTFLFLIVDGIDAIRMRDWGAYLLAGIPAGLSFLAIPGWIAKVQTPLDWSATVISHYGLIGAILASVILLGIFVFLRRGDLRSWEGWRMLGFLAAPIWSPYMLQYSYMSVLFTMRNAGWLRNGIFLIGSLALAALFWREFHVAEQWAMLGMTLLAAGLGLASAEPRD